jgi:iron complex transport system substrate-binding protein
MGFVGHDLPLPWPRRLGQIALLLLGLAHAAVAEAGEPPRIASINMCTDQLLLDLGRREQIVGLSPYARDSARSWAASQAEGLPLLSGTAEEILVLKPDVVVAGRFTRRATREFIRGKGIPLSEFDAVRSVAEARAQMVQMAELTGWPDQAATRLAALDAAVARLKAVASTTTLRILPLSRRGWVSGADSLMSDLLGMAGLSNAAAELGLKAGGFVSLEAIVKLRPDAILISRESDTAEDQGRAMLLHPAIAGLFPPERRIVIPESLTVCGGPMLVEALDLLATKIKSIRPRDASGQ